MLQSSSRRAFLLLPIVGFSGAAYARLIEPSWLEMTERACPISGLANPVDLVHLSDFHASSDVPQSLIERAVQMAIDANPDLICITGDFVSNATGFDAGWYTKVLRRLAAKAAVFAVLGNHDGGLWSAQAGGFRTTAEVSRIVRNAGIQLLSNASSRINRGGAALQVIGVGDIWAGELDAPKAFEAVSPHDPAILLSHNPDSKALVANYKWDLMLSGHTHGGQVVVPVLGINPAPVWDRSYIAGMKPWRGR